MSMMKKSMTPARLLVVEDERITAEDLRDILNNLGYSVTAIVSSGSDAIQQAEQSRPDLVLMDIRIKGDMDGVEAARIIRERFNIPAVYLTAHADPGTLQRAREAEPLGYIVKPFQEPELQASIEMALHKHKVDQRAREREQRLSATLGAIGEGVISINANGQITLLNPAAEAWTGWKQSDALGAGIEEVFRLVSGRDRAPVANPGRRALQSGGLVELEQGSVLITRDGEARSVGGTACTITGHNGKVAGAVLVFGAAEGEAMPAVAHAPETPASAPFEIVFESTAMRRIMNFARRVASSEASTILLEGESGTGKDVIAKYLHYNSPRRSEPFIPINCAAIPETLLESELFGYEKGAFTDAKAQKKGILELAHSGTVFLDEIGEMPMVLQAKLLRVLEGQSFRRLGGIRDIDVDLRVIAATNRSLREAVEQGRFRIDLYYRLNVIQLVVPALRDRRDDILPLANHFIGSFNRRLKRDIKGVAPEAAAALLAHDWPGNVRELRNTIERAMILEETSWLQPSALALEEPAAAVLPVSRPATVKADALEGMSLGEAEKTMLLRALEKTGGNQTRAARLLGISRDALRYKLKKLKPKSTGVSGP